MAAADDHREVEATARALVELMQGDDLPFIAGLTTGEETFRGDVAHLDREWYHPRHDGPGISTVNLSDRIDARVSAELTDRRARCWDDMCDDEPALAAWTQAALVAGRGSAIWKLVDRDTPPVLRRTRSANVIVTMDAGPLLAEDADHVIRALIMQTLTAMADVNGIEPPPTS